MTVDRYRVPDDVKVLVATPNYTNQFEANVHTNHIECVSAWTEQGIDFNWTIVGRTFVHFARTQMCRIAIEGGFTHLFWLDDDATIEPNMLPKFITHDKDVMIAPYCMRRFPHNIGVLTSSNGNYHDHKSYKNLVIEDMNQGLIQVDGGGTHAMLVKTDALKKVGETTSDGAIPDSLFDAFDKLSEEEQMLTRQFIGSRSDQEHRSLEEEDEIGIPYFVMPKSGTEDMYFCYRAKRKGIEIWCDTDVFAGHVGYAPVVTKAYREHVEKTATPTFQEEGRNITIIPGEDAGARDHYNFHEENQTNLA